MADEPLETPGTRIQGRRILADALKTFIFSMSEGLSNRGRRNQSTGAGAALAAPFKMQQMAEAQRLQQEQQRVQADAIRRAAASQDFEAMMKVINETQGRTQAPTVPLTVPGAQAVDPRAQGQVFQGDTQMGPQQLPPFQVKMPGGQTQQIPQQSEQDVTRILRQRADDEQQAQLRGMAPPQKRAPLPVSGLGLFDIDAGKVIPGTEPPPPEPKVDPALVDAISKSPARYHDLPPSIQAGLIPELERRGVKIPQKAIDPSLQAMRELNLTLGRMQVEGGGLTPNQRATEINTMGRRWDTAIKPIIERRAAMAKVDVGLDQVIKKNRRDASQILITAFNKLLDEGSVVREGEYARSTEGQALMNRITGYVSQLQTGGTTLSDAELNAMGAAAKQVASQIERVHGEEVANMRQAIEETLDDYKIPHSRVFGSSVIGKSKVTLVSPDGVEKEVPVSEVPYFIGKGAKVKQ